MVDIGGKPKKNSLSGRVRRGVDRDTFSRLNMNDRVNQLYNEFIAVRISEYVNILAVLSEQVKNRLKGNKNDEESVIKITNELKEMQMQQFGTVDRKDMNSTYKQWVKLTYKYIGYVLSKNETCTNEQLERIKLDYQDFITIKKNLEPLIRCLYYSFQTTMTGKLTNEQKIKNMNNNSSTSSVSSGGVARDLRRCKVTLKLLGELMIELCPLTTLKIVEEAYNASIKTNTPQVAINVMIEDYLLMYIAKNCKLQNERSIFMSRAKQMLNTKQSQCAMLFSTMYKDIEKVKYSMYDIPIDTYSNVEPLNVKKFATHKRNTHEFHCYVSDVELKFNIRNCGAGCNMAVVNTIAKNNELYIFDVHSVSNEDLSNKSWNERLTYAEPYAQEIKAKIIKVIPIHEEQIEHDSQTVNDVNFIYYRSRGFGLGTFFVNGVNNYRKRRHGGETVNSPNSNTSAPVAKKRAIEEPYQLSIVKDEPIIVDENENDYKKNSHTIGNGNGNEIDDLHATEHNDSIAVEQDRTSTSSINDSDSNSEAESEYFTSI